MSSKAVLVFSVFPVLASALFLVSAAQADQPETRTTSSGAVFTRDESIPVLGEAWRDFELEPRPRYFGRVRAA